MAKPTFATPTVIRNPLRTIPLLLKVNLVEVAEPPQRVSAHVSRLTVMTVQQHVDRVLVELSTWPGRDASARLLNLGAGFSVSQPG